MTATAGALAIQGGVAGELISPADELVQLFVSTLERDTTKATYRSACGRFVAWLRDRHGPQVGPERLTLDELAAYQRQLALERSPFTVRKERAALNGLLRFLLEQELVDQRQGRLALAVQGPRPKDVDGRRPIAALTERQYERLVGEGERLAAREPLRGWRDVTIVRLLGECGLRVDELTRLERRDLRPVRRGAKRRELHVRHGKGARIRSVPIAGEALQAVRRWDRLRVEKLGGPPGQALEPGRWPLVCTLGRRRRDRSLTDPGRACGYDTITGVVERFARRADIPEELRHPQCCATPTPAGTCAAPTTSPASSDCSATPTSAPRCATSTLPRTSSTSASSAPSLERRSRSTRMAR